MTWPAWITKYKLLLALAALLLLAYGVLGIVSCHAKRVVKAQTATAQIAAQAAEVHAGQGTTLDQVAAQRDAELAKAQAEVAYLKAQLAKLPAPQPPSAPLPKDDPAKDAEIVQDRQTIVDQAALIAAQDRQIDTQKAQIVTLQASATAWEAAYDDETKRATALELALKAQVAANTSATWKGRIQGFAVGVGAGYIAGRLK